MMLRGWWFYNPSALVLTFRSSCRGVLERMCVACLQCAVLRRYVQVQLPGAGPHLRAGRTGARFRASRTAAATP
jgi:hypothetical protein